MIVPIINMKPARPDARRAIEQGVQRRRLRPCCNAGAMLADVDIEQHIDFDTRFHPASDSC